MIYCDAVSRARRSSSLYYPSIIRQRLWRPHSRAINAVLLSVPAVVGALVGSRMVPGFILRLPVHEQSIEFGGDVVVVSEHGVDARQSRGRVAGRWWPSNR